MLSLILGAVVIVVFLLGVWKIFELVSSPRPAPYRRPASADAYDLPARFDVKKRRAFLVRSERSVYEKLLEAVPADVLVFAGVRLQDVLETRPDDRATYGRLQDKHLDFLLVSLHDYRLLVGVELDGESHDAAEQKYRDAVKDLLLASAGLPLVRITTKETHTADSLRARLEKYWI